MFHWLMEPGTHFDDSLDLVEHRPWFPDLNRREDFEIHLRALGISGDLLAADLALYDKEVQASATAWSGALATAERLRFFGGPDGHQEFIDHEIEERRKSIKQRFSDWLRGRKVVETAHRDETFEVPIFQLHCPAVAGCEVTYSESIEGTKEASWTVTIAGTGMGATNAFKVSRSATFTAQPGSCKVVFVPVRVRVSEVSVYDAKGNFLSKGYQTESHKDQGTPLSRGLRSIGTQCCGQAASHPQPATEEFHLRQDVAGNVSQFESVWRTSSKVEVSVGIDAFDVKIKTAVGVANSRALQLKFKLVGGYTYRLLPCSDIHGIVWQLA